MVLKSAILATVIGFAASPVFAEATQPYSPNVKLFAYEQGGDNYCPAGTQPIRYNGVLCCGVPNATGYRDAPVVAKRVYRQSKPTYSQSKPTYSQSQIPLGKSPHSYDGT